MASTPGSAVSEHSDLQDAPPAFKAGEPLHFGSSPSPVAATVQGLIYAGIAFGLLYLITVVSGREFTRSYQIFAMLSAAMTFMGMRHFDLMTPWYLGRPNSVGNRLLMMWTGIVSVLLFVAYVGKFSAHYSRQVLLIWFVLTPTSLLLLNVGTRWLARRAFPDLIQGRKAVMIFANESAGRFARSTRRSRNFDIVGFFENDKLPDFRTAPEDIPRLGAPSRAADYVRDHDVAVVFIFLNHANVGRAKEVLEGLGNTTASVYCVPDLESFQGARMTAVESVPMLEVAETPIYGVDGLLKQIFDRTAAFFALIFLALPMSLIAILIKLGSPGPVLFKQKRYGLNGREFLMYKFRSMYVDGDALRAETQQATREDPRVTPIGRILRRSSLDELPQILNILKGEMSLVGPRPHTVAHNEFYRNAVRRYMVRHKVRPGLTGLAQVNGFRGETAELELMEKRVHFDIEYMQNWSIGMDVQILLRTVKVVLRGNNAY